MSHLARLVIVSIVLGCVLGLLSFALIAAFEELFSGNVRMSLGRRGGPLLIPVMLGACAGWLSMKAMERSSGMAGSGLVFGLSMLAGGASIGVAKLLCDANLNVAPGISLLVMALVAVGFVGTATWMAYEDE